MEHLSDLHFYQEGSENSKIARNTWNTRNRQPHLSTCATPPAPASSCQDVPQFLVDLSCGSDSPSHHYKE